MKMFFLAIRSLGRNRRRTLITLAAVAFGLTTVHLLIALQSGMYAAMIKSAVSALAGHVVVQAEGYQDEQDSDLVVTNVSEVSARIARVEPGAVIAPRLLLGGLLNSTTSSVGVALSGVDGEAEAKVQDIPDKVVQGEWLGGDDVGIVVGAELARALGVELGDKVVYMGQHGGAPEVQSQLFRVRGIFRTGAAELDGFGAFVDLPAAQAVFGTPDVANRVTVHLADADRSDLVAGNIAAVLADLGLDTRTWRDAVPEMWALIQLDRSSADVVMAILGTIVAMGVLNTMLMSALERTREFGVLLALGLQPQQLSALILLEGAAIGVVGSILGLAIGLAASWPLVHYGIDFSQFVGTENFESAGVVVSSMLKGAYNPVRSGGYTLGAIVFTTLAALYPAVYVARLRPVEAMRHL